MRSILPVWFWAALWGLVAGSALLLGAAVGYFARVPQRLIAAVMAFGAGVLISALSFDLMDEAYKRGGFAATGIGFVGGAAIYTPGKRLCLKLFPATKKHKKHKFIADVYCASLW